MKAYELANVIVKAMGIYCFIKASEYLVSGVMLPFMNFGTNPGFSTETALISAALFVSLYFVIGYVLVFRTGYMLQVLGIRDTDATRTDSMPDFEILALALLGLYFAISGFSKIAVDVMGLWFVSKGSTQPLGILFMQATSAIWTDLIENFIKLIIGIALIAGRDSLTKLWKHLRPLAATRKR